MKYSVLMSVYQGENPEYFQASIDSMLNQTVKPEQFVLIKNGPLTPNLESIIDNADKQNPGLFTFVKHELNQPLGISLDSGIAVCRNEYVARMDSDNISYPERCEMLLKEFDKDPKLSIVGAYSESFYNDDINDVQTIRQVPLTDEAIKRFVRRRSPFNHSTIMFRKSEVVRCGGYGTMSRRKEDLDLFSRLLNMNGVGKNIPVVLMHSRANDASFKRKKSWMYCSDYIQVMHRNWKAKYCSFMDFFIVSTYQILLFILPVGVGRTFTKKILRKKAGGSKK